MIERTEHFPIEGEERAFVDRLGLEFESQGLPRAAGRIVAWLLICEPAEQTTLDLERRLGISKASVSTMTRLLQRLKLIEPVLVPGERRLAFRSLGGSPEDLLREAVRQILAVRAVLQTGLPLVADQPDPLRDRLETLVRLYDHVEAELPGLVERIRLREEVTLTPGRSASALRRVPLPVKGEGES